MKRFTSTLKTALLVAPILGLSLVPKEAWAGPSLVDLFNTCTTIDCSSTIIQGIYETTQSNNVNPFVVQIFSTGNECVRLAMVNQGSTDLETTLISPTGAVWKDDDGGGSLRPLVKANTNVRGWYTLHVSQFAGSAANQDFTLRYGRYPLGNVNCSSPTTPSPAGFAPEVKPTNVTPAPASTGGASDPDGR